MGGWPKTRRAEGSGRKGMAAAREHYHRKSENGKHGQLRQRQHSPAERRGSAYACAPRRHFRLRCSSGRAYGARGLEILSNSVDEARQLWRPHHAYRLVDGSGPGRRQTAAAARSTGIPPKSASTGSLFSASCTGGKYNNNQGVATTTSRPAPTVGLVRHAVRLNT